MQVEVKLLPIIEKSRYEFIFYLYVQNVHSSTVGIEVNFTTFRCTLKNIDFDINLIKYYMNINSHLGWLNKNMSHGKVDLNE